MSDHNSRLIAILTERQIAANLSDAKWAVSIGTSQSNWWRLKRGHRAVGKRLAQKILARFPDLWREVQAEMFPSRETDAA